MAAGDEIFLASDEPVEVLAREMRDVPVLLAHNLEVLVAASRSGVGTRYFGERVWLDPPEVEPWAPWVLLPG